MLQFLFQTIGRGSYIDVKNKVWIIFRKYKANFNVFLRWHFREFHILRFKLQNEVKLTHFFIFNQTFKKIIPFYGFTPSEISKWNYKKKTTLYIVPASGVLFCIRNQERSMTNVWRTRMYRNRSLRHKENSQINVRSNISGGDETFVSWQLMLIYIRTILEKFISINYDSIEVNYYYTN